MVGESPQILSRRGKNDPVVQRLMAAGNEHSSSALAWLDAKQNRSSLRRRATWCIVASWMMVTAATIVGAFVAWSFSQNATEIFIDDVPLVAVVLTPILITLGCASLLGGGFALLSGVFPGLSSTNEAIDWAGTGDAVSRLLAVGCTYPEAFQTAADIAKTRSNRSWLRRAAEEVQQGGDVTEHNSSESGGLRSQGDTAIVELLISTDNDEPSSSWQIVSDHFIDVARSRLALLLSAGPILSTLLSGLIIWLSISATLGSMWRYALESIGGLT